MRTFKVAIVEWEDASHYSQSEDIKWLKEEACPLQISTVGFVLRTNRKQIILTHEVTEKERARNTSVICRRNIKKVIYLKEKNEGR